MEIFSTGAKKQDFQNRVSLCVEVSGHRVALFEVDGSYYAINDPWHGAQYNLATGEVLRSPAPQAVNAYKVLTEDDEIKIEIP